MEVITQFLVDYGYWGMFFSALLAGSFLPFSSEAVILALLGMGLHPFELAVYATVGNVLGGMFNYYIGSLGRMDWVERYLHVKPKDMERARRFMAGRGAWMGFFGFLPFIGSAITILLGYMRSNIFISAFSMTIGKFLRYLLIVYFVDIVALFAFGSARPSSSVPTVVVSIEPYRYLAEQIAGDKVKVLTLVPQGSAPETYEPTAQQMVDVAAAKCYFMIGATSFEQTWASRFSANNDSLRMINTSKGLDILADAAHGHSDPHVWMSALNDRIIAQNICDELCRLIPADASYFRDNNQKLQARLAAVHRQIGQTLSGASRCFVVYHPAYTYFARDYGLTQLTLEHDGKEPSARMLADLLTQARQCGAHTILLQREFANRNTEVVSRSLNITPTVVNPLNYNLPEELLNTARYMARKNR